jgi:hypothetical protein
MVRTILVGLSWCLVSGCGAPGGGPDLPAKGPPLALTDLAAAPWTLASAIETYGRRDVDLVLGQLAVVCLAYGFEQLQVGTYAHSDLSAEIGLYRCESSEQAYGLFTAQRAQVRAGHAVEAGAAGTSDGTSVRVWRGCYLLTVRTVGPVPADEATLVALAARLADQIAERSTPPRLVRALPQGDLVPGSDLYFRFDPALRLVWDFREPDMLRLGADVTSAPAAVGVYAQYLYAVNDANIFIILYRDPEVAAAVAETFLGKLYRPTAVTYRDRGALKEAELAGGTWAYSFRKGPLVVLIPPTRAVEEIKDTMYEYIDNLTDDAGS